MPTYAQVMHCIYSQCGCDHVVQFPPQHYWNLHHQALKSSGSWLGKFERHTLSFSRDYMQRVVPPEQVDRFLSATSLEEQRELFDHWPIEKLRDAYR